MDSFLSEILDEVRYPFFGLISDQTTYRIVTALSDNGRTFKLTQKDPGPTYCVAAMLTSQMLLVVTNYMISFSSEFQS